MTTNALSMRGNHKYIRGGAEKFNRDITKILQPPWAINNEQLLTTRG